MGKNYDVDKLLNGSQTFKVRFAFLSLTLRILTAEDYSAADLIAIIPSDDPAKPGKDSTKYVLELLKRCVLNWTHVDGGKIVKGGKELRCTAENIKLIMSGLPGFGTFIFNHCQSSDTMYRTLDGKEIKN